jgi:hypothetical protein
MVAKTDLIKAREAAAKKAGKKTTKKTASPKKAKAAKAPRMKKDGTPYKTRSPAKKGKYVTVRGGGEEEVLPKKVPGLRGNGSIKIAKEDVQKAVMVGKSGKALKRPRPVYTSTSAPDCGDNYDAYMNAETGKLVCRKPRKAGSPKKAKATGEKKARSPKKAKAVSVEKSNFSSQVEAKVDKLMSSKTKSGNDRTPNAMLKTAVNYARKFKGFAKVSELSEKEQERIGSIISRASKKLEGAKKSEMKTIVINCAKNSTKKPTTLTQAQKDARKIAREMPNDY